MNVLTQVGFLDEVTEKYLLTKLAAYDVNPLDVVRVEAIMESPYTKRIYKAQYDIQAEQLTRAFTPQGMIKDVAVQVSENLILGIPEEDIGAYPFARIWNDRHADSDSKKILWKPDIGVSGWVFNQAYKEYPRDNGRKHELTENEKRVIRAARQAGVPRQLKEHDVEDVPYAQMDEVNRTLEALKEAEKMSDTTTKKKKRIVARAPLPGYDPRKVQAPQCNVHNTDMEFSAVEQKWHCTFDGCSVVARPKRHADDKTIMIGKGSVQMRLVVEESGEKTVLLISDDNVALNITPLVDVDEIIKSWDLEGKDTTAPVVHFPAREVGFNPQLVVMGIEYL